MSAKQSSFSSFALPSQSQQAGRSTQVVTMSMGSNASQNQPMQMAASNTFTGSQGFTFAEPVTSFNSLSSTARRIQMRSSVKMSATNSNFDGPEFFNKNLKDL